MVPLFYNHKELLEKEVVLLFDLDDSPEDIAYLEGITEQKVLRILERQARVVPIKCLHCGVKLKEHQRCIHCEILLHTKTELKNQECGTCTTTKYYQLNDTQI